MNISKVKKIRKFTTGQSRYCQNCGKESVVLYPTILENQKIHQLQYCKECVHKSKDIVSVEK